MQSRHDQNVTGREHCIACCLVQVVEIYFCSTEILVSHIFCSMHLRPSFIYNTTKICYLTKVIDLVLFSPKCKLNLWSTN